MSVVSKMKTTSDIALKKVGLALVVLGLCGAFIRLGFWQLDRAADLKELQKPYIEQPLIALTDVATPSTNLRICKVPNAPQQTRQSNEGK